MKQLSLLRHGDAPISKKGDIYRELSSSGKDDLREVGEKILSLNINFDYILCSPIKRAKDSMEVILEYLPNKPVIGYTEELYSYNGDNLARFIQFLDEKYKNVLIVGHNPLISRIASSIAPESKTILFSTSMFVNFNLQIDHWHDHQDHRGKEVLTIIPK